MGNTQSRLTKTPARRAAAVAIVVLAAAAGVAVAWLTGRHAGVLDGSFESWTLETNLWPVSLCLVALVAAGVVAGLCCLPFILRQGSRRAAPLPGGASLAAFALGPLVLGFFFALTGLAASGVGEVNPRALVYVAAFLFAFYLVRRGVAAMAERLLLSFFIWAALLVAPAFLRDPVNHTAVATLLNAYRYIGVLG